MHRDSCSTLRCLTTHQTGALTGPSSRQSRLLQPPPFPSKPQESPNPQAHSVQAMSTGTPSTEAVTCPERQVPWLAGTKPPLHNVAVAGRMDGCSSHPQGRPPLRSPGRRAHPVQRQGLQHVRPPQSRRGGAEQPAPAAAGRTCHLLPAGHPYPQLPPPPGVARPAGCWQGWDLAVAAGPCACVALGPQPGSRELTCCWQGRDPGAAGPCSSP